MSPAVFLALAVLALGLLHLTIEGMSVRFLSASPRPLDDAPAALKAAVDRLDATRQIAKLEELYIRSAP